MSENRDTNAYENEYNYEQKYFSNYLIGSAWNPNKLGSQTT